MKRSLFGRSLRVLFALLLLSAQQVALSHAISHLDNRGLPNEQKLLCDQHEALGTVAGALDCMLAPLTGVAAAVTVFSTVDLPAVSSPGLAPSSRGPPTLS